MDDVKPDVKPDVATCSPNAQSRLSTSSSAQESQESPPDNKVRWGPHVVSPPPPPARPTASPPARDSTFIRMPRAPRESARQFDVAVNSIRRTRRRKIMAAVILEDSSSSSSDSDTCDLSDLSELTIESWDEEEDDFYDDCWDMKQQPVPDSVETSSHSRDTTRSIGLLRQMSTPRLSSNQDSGASQSGPRIVSIFSGQEEPAIIPSGDREHGLLRRMFVAHHARVYTTAASTRPSRTDPIYSASPSGERVESSHIPHDSRNVNLLRRLTENQQRNSNRSATATSPSGQRVVRDSERTRPSSTSDGRNACRVEISAADQLAAREAARPVQLQVQTTSGGDLRGLDRRDGGEASRATPSGTPRLGRPPGSASRPRVDVNDAPGETPPVRLSAVAARMRNRSVFKRL